MAARKIQARQDGRQVVGGHGIEYLVRSIIARVPTPVFLGRVVYSLCPHREALEETPLSLAACAADNDNPDDIARLNFLIERLVARVPVGSDLLRV